MVVLSSRNNTKAEYMCHLAPPELSSNNNNAMQEFQQNKDNIVIQSTLFQINGLLQFLRALYKALWNSKWTKRGADNSLPQ